MEDKISIKNMSENASLRKQQRGKGRSLIQIYKKQQQATLREFNVQLSPTLLKRMNGQLLTAYTKELVSQVYEPDLLGIGKTSTSFLVKDLPKLRERLQERLSLLKHLVDSLKFKTFGEVQRQILKQWRKNVLFFSLNTIWVTKMQMHKFTSIDQFTDQYKKQIAFISNLTHYYFKEALVILDGESVATFRHLQEETAHKILNSLHEWRDLYQLALLPLLKKRNLEQQFLIDTTYDPRNLLINPQYLDLDSGKAELSQTTQKIRQFAIQCTIHGKIQLLKEMRATFIKQIQLSRAEIVKRKVFDRSSPLEKDDIIGCLIYCIVTGKIKQIQGSIQALSQLLGPNNELLNRRGVDSYRADLQSAVGYLCQQGEVYLISGHSPTEQQQLKIQFTNKSTNLDLDSSC